MQHILTKYGFQRCGIIYVKNGTERIAYQNFPIEKLQFPALKTEFQRLETFSHP